MAHFEKQIKSTQAVRTFLDQMDRKERL